MKRFTERLPDSDEHPDHPADQNPGKNDKGECERRPGSNGSFGRSYLVRWLEERQLFIQREPTAAEKRVRIELIRWVANSTHRFRPPAYGAPSSFNGS
jgi:hypothetical protein